MNYYIGVDGGGTKTAFALWDERGRLCAHRTAEGSSYREKGTEAVARLMMMVSQPCSGNIPSAFFSSKEPLWRCPV